MNLSLSWKAVDEMGCSFRAGIESNCYAFELELELEPELQLEL